MSLKKLRTDKRAPETESKLAPCVASASRLAHLTFVKDLEAVTSSEFITLNVQET